MDDRRRSLIRPFAATALAIAALASASTQALPAPQARSTRVIDDSDRVVLRRNVNPLARPDLAVGRTRADLPMDRMILSLALRPGAQDQLDHFSPSSRIPRPPTTIAGSRPRSSARGFGPTDADVAAVTGWLEDQGFRIDEVAKGRGWINFSGTAGQVESAFLTEMNDYEVAGKLRHANALDPSIPRGLAGTWSTASSSLNSFPRHPQVARFKSVAADETNPEYTTAERSLPRAADFATIYNLGPRIQRRERRQWHHYRYRGALGHHPHRRPVLPNRVRPSEQRSRDSCTTGRRREWGTNDEIESDLDMEWAGAVAPRATLKFVISKSDEHHRRHRPLGPIHRGSQPGRCDEHQLRVVRGCSWGPANAFYSSLWAQAAAQGITSFVSSGDSGAAGCDPSDASIASGAGRVSGLVLDPQQRVRWRHAVRRRGPTRAPTGRQATIPRRRASALSYIPETAWNESGRGERPLVFGWRSKHPLLEALMAIRARCSRRWQRDVPDVSLAAAVHDGYLIVALGGRRRIGSGELQPPHLRSPA